MNELTFDETEEVSGGVTWAMIGIGLGVIGLGITIAATGGIAGLAVPLILGAGTVGEIGLGTVAVGLAGTGGALIGTGINN